MVVGVGVGGGRVQVGGGVGMGAWEEGAAGFHPLPSTARRYDMGMPENVTTFFGGHSLGGAMMPDYVAGAEPDAAGMILMGSFL